MEPAGQLQPPFTKGHSSVVRVADDWYIVCRSEALKQQPLAVTLLGTPLVLFRDTHAKPATLLDRCSHRNTPLSFGNVLGETLQCAYHGWEFDGSGECRAVPGLLGEPWSKGRHVSSFATREQQGFIWVYAGPDVEPEREPFRFSLMGEGGYTTVCEEMAVEATLHATAENALDVPHTAYLHGGLFRSRTIPAAHA